MTPVRPPFGSGNNRQDFYDERDRLIHIIDQLVMRSSEIPDSLRLVTTFGRVNKGRCEALIEHLRDETEDRLVRVRNLATRLLKFLDG